MRNGRTYLAGLRDGRRVFVDGEAVGDVAEHAAFRGITRTVASLYDYAADPAHGMIARPAEGGRPYNKVFLIPRSREDLQARREALAAWARLTNGLVGRGPEHVGGFLAGFAGAPEVFAQADPRFGDHVTRFYRKVAEEDLFVTYVIIPPQVDRSRTAQAWDEKFVQAGVVAERDGGIVVRGAQMLGTGAAVSDYLFVSCITPLKPGDEPYANSFVVPIGAKGLKLYCRPPYAPGKSSVYDYPLSTRFDESDAFAVFDDVFVPWEQVFVYRDVERVRSQFFETAAHVLGNTQAQIRLAAKLKFILGLARKIAAATQVDVFPGVQEKLGELSSLAAIVEGMVLAAEASATLDKNGVARPHPRYLYGAMGLQSELYPRALQILRELAGGGVVQVPSSYKDFLNPESRDDLRKFVRAAGLPAEERVKLFKLAWDVVGTEFGGRHQQYEMFYAGAPHVAKGYAFRHYGMEEATRLVDDFLGTYSLETEKP
ncbi:MAG TPA: 4-hydroxyphenylacetate 3-hydroxylase N-terminal domain-containing protein [Planctomycetota bacterium]|nr:4-hydroxyphenylacetate 3-hydroxylase N-terminal domain-containing protein [Planctomycetota bacterium]